MANPYVPNLPEAAQARLAAARDLVVQGRTDEVQRAAADLAAEFPDNPQVLALAEGAAYRGMEDYPAALEALDRAADAPADTMEHIPDWPDLSEAVIMVDRAGVLLAAGQLDEARAAAEAALTLYGDRPEAAEA